MQISSNMKLEQVLDTKMPANTKDYFRLFDAVIVGQYQRKRMPC